MSIKPQCRRRGAVALLLAGVAAGGLLAGSPLGAPAAQAQSAWNGGSSPEDLRYRLDTLDAELADLRARLGGARVSPAAGGAAGALSNSNVTQLEGEVRRLTASVEEMQNEIRRIGEEAARRFSDIEFRLTELEGGDVGSLEPVPPLGGAASPVAPAPPENTVPEPVRAPTARPSQSTGAGGQSPVSPPASGIVQGPSGQGGFAGVAVPLPGQSGQQVASVAEQGSLDRAVQDVRQGRFDQADERLRKFLKQNPTSPLTSEAWYWLGESQFVRGNHAEAARSFLNGYNADQAGPRAPHNLYRLGVTLGRLGQTNEACLTLREVRTRFPDAPDGIVEQADAEADALACG